jgi:hypothetical protein
MGYFESDTGKGQIIHRVTGYFQPGLEPSGSPAVAPTESLPPASRAATAFGQNQTS